MTEAIDSDRDAKGRFRKKNAASLKHGLYSVIRKRAIPSIRGTRALYRHLDRTKSALEAMESDDNVRRELLIADIMRAEEKLGMLDLWLRKIGLLEPRSLEKGKVAPQPCLNIYAQLLSTKRQALIALGLDEEKVERAISAAELAESVDAEKEGISASFLKSDNL